MKKYIKINTVCNVSTGKIIGDIAKQAEKKVMIYFVYMEEEKDIKILNV